jgi:hypothetical protein
VAWLLGEIKRQWGGGSGARSEGEGALAKWWMGGPTVGTSSELPEAGGARSARVLCEIGEEREGLVGRLRHGPAHEVGPIGRFKRVQTKNSNDFKKFKTVQT